ncbi:hypothetical protein E2562_033612 [Oryza meyeriana var. granulata]|uniref:KIB1-4 beta-propeller domain-containing protein n=1 Tax=Oryza meyeriana var. granulata TaxID=110450 RepID=A0A6G1FF08_9ORYZ|nr:hypothetical protein E2562_033612 [Oryza meyeriana var. granulata]
MGPRIPDNARGTRICGSFPGGWVTVDDIPRIDLPASRWNHGPALLNLCTGEQIDLPTSLRDNNPRVRNINLIHAVILSDDPSDIHPYCAAAIVPGKPNIAFWRPGMSYWTPPMLKWDAPIKIWQKQLSKDTIEDVKYFVASPLGVGFHVLTNKEDLLVYTPKTNDKRGELTMSSVKTYRVRRNPSPTMLEPGEVLARYLAQSGGEMLMVARFVSTEKATVAFDVFRLEQQPPPSWSWKKLTSDTLTDQRIFLVRGCSVAIQMRNPNPCPLHIYFLDESASFDSAGTLQSPQIENPFPCGDTGRCRLFDQEIVHCLPPGPPSDCSPWTWFFLPQMMTCQPCIRVQDLNNGNHTTTFTI